MEITNKQGLHIGNIAFDMDSLIATMQNLELPILIVDKDYMILYADSGATGILNTTTEKAHGNNLSKIADRIDLDLPNLQNPQLTFPLAINENIVTNIKNNLNIQLTITKASDNDLYLIILKQQADKRLKQTEENTHKLLALMNYEVTGQKYDVTDKTSEEYALSIKNYLENIIANMPGNVYWMSKDGRFLGCNNNMLKTLGFKSRKEHFGKTYEDVFEPEEIEAIRKADNEIMELDQPKLLEERAIKQKEIKATYLTQKVPLHNEAGEVIGLVGISFDITEKKKLEQQIQDAEIKGKLQESKIQAMKTIAASLAHELRTPLAAIANQTSVSEFLHELVTTYEIAKTAELDIPFIRKNHIDALRRGLDAIKDEADYASNLINMLLTTIKKLEKPSTEFKKQSITTCIDDAIKRYPFTSEKQSKLIAFEKSPDFIFEGEALVITHVISNLLKNALYYVEKSDKGGITIKLKRDQRFNQIIFTDTGTGIAKDVLPHIFEHFFTKTLNGTGIGLAFCKMVMQNLGGDMTCESVEGEFTKFTLSFPVVHKQ